jgi:hypothetical protein
LKTTLNALNGAISYLLRFRVFKLIYLVPFLLLALQVLAQAGGEADAKTAWCTSGEDFDRNEEHGCFDFTDQITNRL